MSQGYFPRDLDWHPDAYTPQYKTSILRSPQKARIGLEGTITENTGPVFGHNMLGEFDNNLIVNYAQPGESAQGERIMVHGYLLDEEARPVRGALIEFWQANAGGRYRHKKDQYLAPLDPNFGGCGRTISGDDGYFQFFTIKPGPYPWPNGVNDWRPAHIHFSVFGAAFAQRLITQMYFEGDPHIAICPIVNTIKDPDAIDRLTARLDMHNTRPMDMRAYRWDIVLRGKRSVKFDNRLEGN